MEPIYVASTGQSISKADDYTLTINWDLRDNLTLTSIPGYLDGELTQQQRQKVDPVRPTFLSGQILRFVKLYLSYYRSTNLTLLLYQFITAEIDKLIVR